jgi:hypothetical protein
MKRNTFLTIIALSSLYTILSSNSTGPGGNRSGSPGSSGNCSACHGASDDKNAQITLEITKDGNSVEKFIPGNTYDLKLKASASSTKIGFHLTAVNENNTGAGTFSNESAGTQTYMAASSQQIWSHTTPGNGTWTCKWTAPSTPTKVRFFSSLVLSNGNGNNSGDLVNSVNWELEAEESNATPFVGKGTNKLLGNPSFDKILFEDQVQWLTIWNLNGQMVFSSTTSGTVFDVSSLNNGIYQLCFQNSDGKTQTLSWVKQ